MFGQYNPCEYKGKIYTRASVAPEGVLSCKNALALAASMHCKLKCRAVGICKANILLGVIKVSVLRSVF